MSVTVPISQEQHADTHHSEDSQLKEAKSSTDGDKAKPMKRKKGKKFLDNAQMLNLMDAICSKEDKIISEKTAKMLKYKRINDEAQKKVKQRQKEKKMALKQKKRELKAKKSAKTSPPETEDVSVDDEKPKKKVKFHDE